MTTASAGELRLDNPKALDESLARQAKEFFNEGKAKYEEGKFKEAIIALEKSVELDETNAPAFNYLGLAYKETDADLAEIIWYFKNAVEIDPEYAQAYDNLGKAYYGLGDFDKAIANCDQAIAIDPNLGSSHLALGWIYLLGKSNPSKSIPYFKKVVERYKVPNAHYGLGLAYFMNGENALILEEITALRELKQDNLAQQLENVVRGHDYITPKESAAPLVNIPKREEAPAPSKARGSVSGTLTPQDGTSNVQGTTQVRMRGKLVNTNNPAEQSSSGQASSGQSGPLPYGQNPVPYGQNLPTTTKKKKPQSPLMRARAKAQANRNVSVSPPPQY